MSGPGVPVRLLSWNVRSRRDDAAALGRVLTACRPDVVCLQEVPRFLRWRSSLAALARSGELVVVGGGPHAGACALLSRLAVEVLETEDLALSRTGALPPPLGLHRRGAAVARVSLRGRPFAVASTHLGLDADERLRHAAELRAELDRLATGGLPVLLGGDLNEEPDGPARALLAWGWTDAGAAASPPTFPARDPRRSIDTVVVTPGVEVVRLRVPGPGDGVDPADLVAASDHLPLLADLRLPA